MNNNLIYFFVDFQRIKCFDTEKDIYRSGSFKVLERPDKNNFRMTEHFKE